ncbi:MAG: 30S ribosomal protein S6 [Deltaproteobacteria bacterium]|nr:30S ribosomal protein S6 [Deltaproteobacteria bacterium]
MTQVTTPTRAPHVQLGREYELVYILNPNVDPDDAEKISNRIQEVVARLGGKITKVDQWGRRRLAYNINKFTRGIFVFVKLAGFSDLVAEIERNLRNADAVIRFQTIKLDGTVEIASVAVNPDEVKFERLAVPTEEEPEPSLEERLGLVVRPRERTEEEFVDDFDGPDLNNIPDLGNAT